MVTMFDELRLPEHARHTARVLKDYDHELHLERLPDRHPYIIARPDRPWAVIHRPIGLPEYVVDSFPETMLDERLLGIIVEWDARRVGKDISRFDAANHARHVLHERARADEIAEGNDRMKFALDKRRWS